MPGAIQASSLESETSNAAAKDSLGGYEIGVTTLIEVMAANAGKGKKPISFRSPT